MTAKYYADKALLKLGGRSLPITADDIQVYMEADGWKFVSYDINNPASLELMESLGAIKTAKQHRGFSYVSDDLKLVCYRECLSAEQRTRLFAHEFGHEEMGHVSPVGIAGYVADGLCNEPQEAEANEFAVHLIAPACVLKRALIFSKIEIACETLLDKSARDQAFANVRTHRKLTHDEKQIVKQFRPYIWEKLSWIKRCCIGIGTLLLVYLIFSAFGLINKTPQSTPVEQPKITDSAVTESTLNNKADMVVITQSGDKYHTPGCRYVKNKTNIIEISVGQAEEMGKTPCSVCIK